MSDSPGHRSPKATATPWTIVGLAVLALVVAACGGGSGEEPVGDAPGAGVAVGGSADDVSRTADEPLSASDVADVSAEGIRVVTTTSILADVVGNLLQDDGTVTSIIPNGVDPHAFQPSAADAAMLRDADLVVANGLQLEENLVSALAAAAAEGVRVFELADKLDPIEFGNDDHGHDDHGHDDHGHDEYGHDEHGHDDGHGHDEHGHDDHDHGPEDPHVWFDPVRMADGVLLLAEQLATLDSGVDDATWLRRAEAYAAEILAVHDTMASLFATIAPQRRVLVTNHDALGYLAHRYDFEVLGTVIPGSSTQAEADARSFAALVDAVERAGVTVIFAENTDTTVLAEQLASEVVGRGDLDVEVVALYTDALGAPGSQATTYLELLETNARRITDALG